MTGISTKVLVGGFFGLSVIDGFMGILTIVIARVSLLVFLFLLLSEPLESQHIASLATLFSSSPITPLFRIWYILKSLYCVGKSGVFPLIQRLAEVLFINEMLSGVYSSKLWAIIGCLV